MHVLSERAACSHSAWANNYQLEDVLVSSCGAGVLAPEQVFSHTRLEPITGRIRRGRYRTLKNAPPEGADLLVLVGMGPSSLRMLNALPHWRTRYRTAIAYIVDTYPPSEAELDRSLGQKLDAVFVSYSQMRIPIQDTLRAPTYFLPQAADVLGTGGFHTDRRLDLAAFGRQPTSVLETLTKEFAHPASPYVGWWSQKTSPYSQDMPSDRAGFLALLRRTRVSLCYRYEDTHPNNYRGVSPITARWFEAAASGCVIAGSRPSSAEGTELLNWEDAVIPLSTDGPAFLGQVRDLLDAPDQTLLTGMRNFQQAAGAHDWRHRIASILQELSLKPPPSLVKELATLSTWSDGERPVPKSE